MYFFLQEFLKTFATYTFALLDCPQNVHTFTPLQYYASNIRVRSKDWRALCHQDKSRYTSSHVLLAFPSLVVMEKWKEARKEKVQF